MQIIDMLKLETITYIYIRCYVLGKYYLFQTLKLVLKSTMMSSVHTQNIYMYVLHTSDNWSGRNAYE